MGIYVDDKMNNAPGSYFPNNKDNSEKLIPTSMDVKVKPFLKWAGGKKQLLHEFVKRFPDELKNDNINKYVEPFVGGGAVLFHVIQNFSFDEIHIYDANEELILVYTVVKDNVDELIEILKSLEYEYLKLEEDSRKKFYYSIRDKFNLNKKDIHFEKYSPNWIHRAAFLIFLNKTCFNGLFRVNSRGQFNVPFGKYKNPKIANEKNLRNASIALQNVEIHHGDFETCEPIVDNNTFVYFDPPYRPLSKTSNFTSYSKDTFDENSQKRLAKFYRKLNDKSAKLMLSNSDPKNIDAKDHFFEEMYSGFTIERVHAKRMINAKAKGRGEIHELVITNY
ncbi:DNA adenine methylase [Methanohalophilus sp.]